MYELVDKIFAAVCYAFVLQEKLVSGVRPRNVGLLVVLVLCSIFLFFGPTDNWSWDPSFYYAQLRSPIIDGDLDLSQEVIPAAQSPPGDWSRRQRVANGREHRLVTVLSGST